ncbi:MAG: PspC domain-containing protein [Kineosporiaceae bacterium]
MRPAADGMVAGVAAGVAAHLRLPVRVVRIVFVVAALNGGLGLLLYGWLWALVPADDAAPPGAVPGPATPGGGLAGTTGAPVARPGGQRTRSVQAVVGIGLIVVSLAWVAQRAGVPVRLQVIGPLVVILAGAAVVFAQLDSVERARWAQRAQGEAGLRGTLLRVGAGVVLVAGGLLLLVVQGSGGMAQIGSSLTAAVAVLAGVAVVLAPWLLRLWRDLDAERAARAREAERADIAAHLHDSVLQTLALIQRRSADAAEVARLARAQERDLRSWLYGAPTSDVSTVAAAVEAVAADLEDLHGTAVEVVTVGDAALDEPSGALVAALREAVANAVRHGEGTVRVYVECTPEALEAFVRDRGPGFDPERVPADRLGLRESIIGRMERHGGSAVVKSVPGEGTEVRLRLPRRGAGVPVHEEREVAP